MGPFAVRTGGPKAALEDFLQMNFTAYTALIAVYAAIDGASGILTPCTPYVLLILFVKTSAVAGWCLFLDSLTKNPLIFASGGIFGGAAIVFTIGNLAGTIPFSLTYALIVAAMVAGVFGCVWLYFFIRIRSEDVRLNDTLRALHAKGAKGRHP